MPLSETAKNLMLDELGTSITHLALFNNTTEVTGGTYARQAVTWGSAAAGAIAMSGTETFDVPGGQSFNRVTLKGHISDASPDYGYASVPTETFGSDGEAEVTSYTITLSDPE